MSSPNYDVVIVGSGIVGATAALTIANYTSLNVAVIEAGAFPAKWGKDQSGHRVSAISLASKNIFQHLGVWESIVNKRVSPYTQMQVWDAEGQAEIHFDAADVDQSVLGYIIEDSVLRLSLLEQLMSDSRVDFINHSRLVAISSNPQADKLRTITVERSGKNESITTRLIIAADGAHSAVRELAGIEIKTWDYEHTAIIATIEAELPHCKTAWQRFLPKGPLAFLPLEKSNQCSIVWSVPPTQADELLLLDDNEFCKRLAEAFKYKLGAIRTASSRYHFPLRMRHAKSYVQPGLALIGDAAHTIHPLAGQGVNLGLLDAVNLADVIAEAAKKNRNFSSEPTLRRYERARKSDNVAMLAGVELLKKGFTTQNSAIQFVRNAGMNATNHTQWLKKFIINYALGYRGGLPEMAINQ